MTSLPPENDLSYFGFTDLIGFKDFLVEVIAGAPDDFMEMDWLKPEEQMNLHRAFVGLRYGLDLAAAERGETETITTCRQLVDQAQANYQAGRNDDGQHALVEVETLIGKIS